MEVHEARLRPEEQERISDLMSVVPKGMESVLDIGARDGYLSEMLTHYFTRVTALDLEKPAFTIPNVETVKGDVTCLDITDNSFDIVFCSEVLEHIPSDQLQTACTEISRIAKNCMVIGVPYRQDTRVGKTTCGNCGYINPPWGHVNTFDEHRLKQLFPGAKSISTTYIGSTTERTNFVSSLLNNLAGNPWGTYDQDEECVQCGCNLEKPENINILKKILSKLAKLLNIIQHIFIKPSPLWIHVVFCK